MPLFGGGGKSEPAAADQTLKQYDNWKDFAKDLPSMNASGWLVVSALSAPKTVKGVFAQGVGYDIVVVYERPKSEPTTPSR